MPAVEAVLFDLGGVLFHFDRGRRLAHLAAATGLSEQMLQAAMWDSGFDADCDRGLYDVPTAHREACALMGREITTAVLVEAMASAFSPNRAVLALVERLRPEVGLALLTNNGPLVKQGLLEAYGDTLERFGEMLFFSADLGLAKPDPRAFLQVAGQLGIKPVRILLVDDSDRHLVAAQGLGFCTHHYSDAEALGGVLDSLRLLKP